MIRKATWLDSMQLTAMWSKMHHEINTRPAMLREFSNVEVFFQNIVQRLSDPNWLIFIAEEEEIQGFIMGKLHWPMYSQCHIVGTCEALYVYPQFRGNGLYKKLISAIRTEAEEKGAKEVELTCVNDERILKFYDRLGYEPVQVVLRQKEKI